jgi:hypothetical protein
MCSQVDLTGLSDMYEEFTVGLKAAPEAFSP